MARVPTRDNFRVLPGGRGAARTTDPGTGRLASVQGRDLSQAGAALQQVGAAGAQIAELEQDKINQARVREAALQLREEIAETEREYQQFKGAELVSGDRPVMQDLEARLESRRSEILGGLTSRDAQDAFEGLSLEMSASWKERAAAYEAEQGQFYIEQQRDGIIQAQIEKAISNPVQRASSLSEADSVLREKFRDKGFDGERLDQAVQASMAALMSGQVETLLEAGDTAVAREVVDAGLDYLSDDAKRVLRAAIKDKQSETRALLISRGEFTRSDLSELREAGEIDDGDVLRHEAQIGRYEARRDADLKRAEAEAQSVRFAELQVGISDGVMGREDVDLAYENGQINESQWSQASRQANAHRADKVAENAFLESMQLGLPIDPTDSDTKKGADQAFRALGGKALFATDFDAALAATAQFAQAGIIPETAETVLRGMKASGAPEQQMFALDAIGKLYTDHPNATNAAFNDDEVSDAISYSHKVSAGVDPRVAYEALLVEQEARNNPLSGHQRLIDKGREISKDFTLSDALRRRDADGERGFGPFWNDGSKVGSAAKPKHVDDPLIEAQILNDYSASFESHYAIHGDEKLAKRQAAAAIGRTVGVSQANGGRAMMYPPEQVYGLDGDWAADALAEMFSDREGGVTDIRLISDTRTVREVRDGMAPTYGVVVFDDAGVMTPLQARVDFQDEYASELERRQEEARKANLNDARKRNAKALQQLRNEDFVRNMSAFERAQSSRDIAVIGARPRSQEKADRAFENAAKDKERLEDDYGSD